MYTIVTMTQLEQAQTILARYFLFGNSFLTYAQALAVFLSISLALKLFELIIIQRLEKLAKKSKTYIDDAIVAGIKGLGLPMYIAVSLYFSLALITLPDPVARGVNIALYLVMLQQIMRGVGLGFSAYIEQYIGEKENNGQSDAKHARAMLGIMRGITISLLWIVALLFLASNIGINVTSLVASLGIGGIAVALALQNVLGDMFSSFSIFIDKPFQVGDFIQVGENSGTVKYIGMRSTRIQTQRGQELVISNRELTMSKIENFRLLERRRDVIVLNIPYGLPRKALEEVPGIVKKVISSSGKLATYDRCHLRDFADSSIQFEIVYYVETADYMKYMSCREKILLGVYTALAREKIDIPYPTQIIKLEHI